MCVSSRRAATDLTPYSSDCLARHADALTTPHSRGLPLAQRYARCETMRAASVDMAVARVSARVAQGGHAIPEAVIRRRFATGLHNFHKLYKVLVDSWTHYDNSGQSPVLIASEDNR